MRGRLYVLQGLIALSFGLMLGYSALGHPTVLWACAALISAGAALTALIVSARAGRQPGGTAPGRTSGRERCLRLGLALLALSLVAIQLLGQPLPESITRRKILASDGSILTRYDAPFRGGSARAERQDPHIVVSSRPPAGIR